MTSPGPCARWRLVYDDSCAVCQVATAAVVLVDRRAVVVPCGLGRPEANELVASVPSVARSRSMHLVAPDGRVFSAGAACVQLCRLLPGFGGLGRLGGAAPDVAERVYAWALGHRVGLSGWLPTWLGRWARSVIGMRDGAG